MKTAVTIIGLLAGAIAVYLVVRLMESVTRISFLRAAWWGIRGNMAGLAIPTTIIVLLAALMVAGSTNLLLTLLLAEGRGVVVMGHSRDELLVVEPAYPERGVQQILEITTNADTPGGYPGQSFSDIGTTRVILTYRGDTSYEISVMPRFAYVLFWIFTGFMIFFAAGLCLFLMSEYGGSLRHSAVIRGGDDIAQAIKQNTRFGVGLWVLVLVTALFVLSAVSVHFSRKFDPLHEEVELYRRRVAATIFETVRPGDELSGTVVVKNDFRMDGTGYIAYEIEFADIADAPLYVNVVISEAGNEVSQVDSTASEVTESYSVEQHRSHRLVHPRWQVGQSVQVRVTKEMEIEPLISAAPDL